MRRRLAEAVRLSRLPGPSPGGRGAALETGRWPRLWWAGRQGLGPRMRRNWLVSGHCWRQPEARERPTAAASLGGATGLGPRKQAAVGGSAAAGGKCCLDLPKASVYQYTNGPLMCTALSTY